MRGGRGKTTISTLPHQLLTARITHPRYRTLLHRIKTSPRAPFDFPFSISSVFANCVVHQHPSLIPRQHIHSTSNDELTCRFMNPSVEMRYPRYCKPHFSRTLTTLPVNSCRYGFGLTGYSHCQPFLVIFVLARLPASQTSQNRTYSYGGHCG